MTSSSLFTARSWCATYFALVAALLMVIAGVNYALDFYGLFGDSTHRGIRVYANERTVKYLLSLRYIPENFQGIMIGTSISENWDITRVGPMRIYNASVSGANISEEKLIADNVFARGHIRLAVFCIHPYLTLTHGRKTDYMNPREYWGALGSIQLLRDYTGATLEHLAGEPAFADANGVGRVATGGDEGLAAVRWQRALRRAQAGAADMDINPQSFDEYAALVRTAHAHGAVVVGFIPPIYSVGYQSQRQEYDSYFARVRALFEPEDIIVDFNAPQYSRYTTDLATFYDGTHLSDSAARFFSRELARLLGEELERRSRQPVPVTAHLPARP